MNVQISRGYILPATLAFSLVTVALAITLLQFTTSVTSLLREDYYRALAKEAAQSGARMASDCYGSTIKEVANWGASATLNPNKNCSLGVVAGASSYLNEQQSGNTVVRTTYSVPRPTADEDGVTFISAGTVHVFSSAASATPVFSYSETVRIKDFYEQDLEAQQQGPARLIAHAPQGLSTFTTALTADGTLYHWGLNHYTVDSATPVPVEISNGNSIATKTIVQVAIGMTHAVALTSDGLVYSWGNGIVSSYRFLGSDVQRSNTPIPAETAGTPMAGKHIVQVAAGSTHTLAVSSEGKVYSWGYQGPQLGSGATYRSETFPIEVATTGTPMAGKHIVQVAAGDSHSLALDTDGVVYAWGNNMYGRLGDGTTSSRNTPVAVKTAGTPMEGKHIVQISAGRIHSTALASDGTVYSWGYGGAGILGDGLSTSSSTPVAVKTAATPMEGKHIVQISAGSNGNGHTLALASDGTVYSWGYGIGGALGDGGSSSRSEPVAVRMTGTPLAGKKVVEVSAGASSYALASDGTLYSWGSNIIKQLGSLGGSTSIARQVPIPPLNPPPLVPPTDPNNPPARRDTIHF
ncbi:MAG: RCC1 domain-containing protein [Candidatus Saccharimonadales bacterium]